MTSLHAWVTAVAGSALLCLALITVHVRAEVYMEGYEMARCAQNCERLERLATVLQLDFERLRGRPAATAPSAPATKPKSRGRHAEGVRP